MDIYGVRMRRLAVACVDKCDLLAMMELNILFEYKGSWKPLRPIKRKCVVQLIQKELVWYSDTAAVMQLFG